MRALNGFMIGLLALMSAHADTAINCYGSTADQPTRAQQQPLETVVTLYHAPATIHTVRDAVQSLLTLAGYRLAPKQASEVKAALDEPLPVSQRHLGPIPIKQALRTVMTPRLFHLEVDPVHRLVAHQPLSVANSRIA